MIGVRFFSDNSRLHLRKCGGLVRHGMTRIYFLVLLPLLCGSAQSQPQVSLSDQINAVSVAQENERARQEALRVSAAARAAQVAAQQEAARTAVEQQRPARQRAVHHEAMAARKARHDSSMIDNKQSQMYEDQLHALQVKQAELQLLEQQQKLTVDRQRDQAYEDQLRALEIRQER